VISRTGAVEAAVEQRGTGGAGERTTLEVVVPLRPGDHATLVHCLSALLQQTRTPQRVVLVDDGGPERDHALQMAREFARANDIGLAVVRRRWSIGHVATLKRQARESDADVLVLLPPSTVLESPDYLQACVEALDGAVGVGSACGRVEALWPAHRRRLERLPAFRHWVADDGYVDPLAAPGRAARIQGWLAAAMLSHMVRLGLDLPDRATMRACGSVVLPAGAVAYRRRYLRDLFNRVEPVRGDDLGAWPGQVIAHAFATEGYRAMRIDAVTARIQPPALSRLPRLCWSGWIGWLQAGYWFDPLLRSPLRQLTRRWRVRGAPHRLEAERRAVEEAFREPFGERITRLQGRPIGRYLLRRSAVLAGLAVLAWVLVLQGRWTALGVLALLELALACVRVARVAPASERGSAVLHALVSVPLRWGGILLGPVAMLRVVSGIWLDRRFRWRRNAHRGSRQRGARP